MKSNPNPLSPHVCATCGRVKYLRKGPSPDNCDIPPAIPPTEHIDRYLMKLDCQQKFNFLLHPSFLEKPKKVLRTYERFPAFFVHTVPSRRLSGSPVIRESGLRVRVSSLSRLASSDPQHDSSSGTVSVSIKFERVTSGSSLEGELDNSLTVVPNHRTYKSFISPDVYSFYDILTSFLIPHTYCHSRASTAFQTLWRQDRDPNTERACTDDRDGPPKPDPLPRRFSRIACRLR